MEFIDFGQGMFQGSEGFGGSLGFVPFEAESSANVVLHVVVPSVNFTG